MKTQPILHLVAIAATFALTASLTSVGGETNGTPGAAQGSHDIIPAGSIKFIHVESWRVLEVYAELAHAKLEPKWREKLPPVLITFENKEALTRKEALEGLEKAFREQAGIVITHPDPKHVGWRLRSSDDKK